MTWEIVLGIIALVGFIIAIMKPIIKLNSSTTKLNCSIDMLVENGNKTDKRLTKHGEQLDDHEHRIIMLEAHTPHTQQ